MAEPLSFDELLAAAEQQDYISIAEKQAKELKPIREGLGYFSPKSLLGQGAALGQYGQGGVMDALGFGAALFNYPEFAAEAKKEAANFYKTGQSYGEDGGQGFYNISETEKNPVSNLFFGTPPTLDERITDFVPTLGFEGGVEQEMSTEEEMTGMPGPIGGMSNAERVQEALFGATPAFEKSGRGKAPVKEERFFTGEGKPKPGEMMDTDFLRNPDLTAPGTEKAMEDTFKEAILDTAKAKGETVTPETQEELLAKYKKEFYDATGLDSSGKVDKSAALMALGLSLMQNKAGKGFNVGKMLSAVGEAGEKALPELTKAKNKAEAASLAAGKYALGQIKAGESSKAAFAKEVRTNNFNYLLQKMELEEKAKLEKIKSVSKPNEIKNIASVPIGAGTSKVRIGDLNGVSVFASGPTDAGAIVDSYNKYTDGQQNVALMNDALTAISDSNSSAVKILGDRAKSLGVAWGVVDGKNMFGEKEISDEADFEKLRQSTINAFKKLILQESQVSNLDLTTLFASFGEVSFMKNPKEAEAAIELMADYFSAKKRSLEPVLNDFSDRSWFRSNEDYKRTQEKLSKMGETYTTQATAGEGGKLTIDLSSIPKINSDN